MTSAGHRHISLHAGAYAPVVTIFKDNEAQDLDLEAQKKHAVRLARDGLVGLVAMGSNGEQVHLTREERASVISAMRSALDDAGFGDVPIIAGCTEQGTRSTIEHCQEAAQAGASYAIILPPCYYKPAMTSDAIFQYFSDVADKSPIPLVMYNYPGAVAGVDMDSDLMIRIAEHRNVQGAKFTCANTGKLTRLAAATNAISTNGSGSGFLATGGFADMVLQVAVSGGSGVVAGTGNLFPKLCARTWSTWADGKHAEAYRMQKVLADADWTLSKSGISGTKAALQQLFGYGGIPRRPLQASSAAEVKSIVSSLQEALALEKSL